MNLYRLTTASKNTEPWAVPPRAEVRRVTESAASDPDNQQSLRQQLAENGGEQEFVELSAPPALSGLADQLRALGDYADHLLKRLDSRGTRHPYRPIDEEV